MGSEKKFDIVILGASGFTGKFVVEEIANLLRDKKIESFTWAVAGRSKDKLIQMLTDVSDWTGWFAVAFLMLLMFYLKGYNVKSTQMLEVNLANPSTIHEMARQAVIVVNCVGPYCFWGEIVIQACIQESAHHLDISGEVQFLEKTHLTYDKAAKEKGVYVLGACGFESILADMGVKFLKDKFNGDLNSVEMIVEFGAGAKNTSLNFGSWVSALNVFANLGELGSIRAQLFQIKPPLPKYPLGQRSFVHYNPIVKAWCAPIIASPDKPVVERSEQFFYEKERKRPIQFNAYVKQENIFHAILLRIGFMILGILSLFEFTRNILLKYPRFFTMGFVSAEGPTREEANFPVTVTLAGEGWKEKLTEVTDQHTSPPNKKMIVKVKATNPGYGATPICLVQSALTVLRESSKMPSSGGVLTTAAAFSETTIIPRLHKCGVTFEVSGNDE